MALKLSKLLIILVCCTFVTLLVHKNISLKTEIQRINESMLNNEDLYHFRAISSSLNVFPKNSNNGDTFSISPYIQIDFWEGVDSVSNIPLVYFYENNEGTFSLIDSMLCYTNRYFDYAPDSNHNFLHGYMKIPFENIATDLNLPFTISLTEYMADSIFKIESKNFSDFVYSKE